MAVGKRESDNNIKPESVISSEYDPVKSEETDDEDMCNETTDRSSSHENLLPINIKEEAVKVEVKAEDDDIITDDERSPEYVVSSSSGYDPVKSEETDDEDNNDTNTSNE